MIVFIILSTLSSLIIISILILSMISIEYSEPLYLSVCPFCRPKPDTLMTVIPPIPSFTNASLTSLSLKGLIIASIFFIYILS
uniref:Nitrogen regulatory protein PII n=1 Tax=Bangia fuscopurpurea TaxID=101920 RepID=A0A0F6VXQ2_BANFU|nr:nitrogen regulatory protein PII [Bangia fuscopurpurea]